MNTMLHLFDGLGADRCVKLGRRGAGRWFDRRPDRCLVRCFGNIRGHLTRHLPDRLPGPLPAWAAACVIASAGLASAQASAAPWPGIVTIVDAEAGQASVVRGVARLQLAEGVHLVADDIVETGAAARLARIEFADGVNLNLGPETRVWLAPRLPAERSKAAPRFYLLRGWVKLEVPASIEAAFASPAFDASGSMRALVASVAPEAAQVFAETGEARLRPADGTAIVVLKNGELWSRSGEPNAGVAKASVAPRPPPAFIQRVPRTFLDTLPVRAALFKGRELAPKPLAEPAYAELQAWLDAEPALRKAMLPRWRPLLRNAEFRRGLVAGLPAHPEWDRVLFPEKYAPRPAGSAPPTTAPATSRPAPAAPPPGADPYRHSPSR